MSSNNMGGRRIGKKYHNGDRNVEEDSDYFTNHTGGHLSDWEKLLVDYKKDKAFIKSQKRKWLPPKQRK